MESDVNKAMGMMGAAIALGAVFALLLPSLAENAKAAFIADQVANPRTTCGNGLFIAMEQPASIPSWVSSYLDDTSPANAQGPFCSVSNWTGSLNAYSTDPTTLDRLTVLPQVGFGIVVGNNGTSTAIVDTPPSQPGYDLTIIPDKEALVVCWQEVEPGEMRVSLLGYAGGKLVNQVPLDSLEQIPAASEGALQSIVNPVASEVCEQATIILLPGNSASIYHSARAGN